MKVSCHRCGRDYLAARSMAGKAVRCRSCGAMNDGAGGPPPEQPSSERRAERGGKASPISSGASFRVGDELQAPPPLPMTPMTPPGQRPPSPESVRRMNLVVKSAAVFLFVVAAVGGLSIWILKRPAGVAGKWEPLQWAVPQVVGDAGSGSGFVTEIKGRLWLVTNYHVLDGESEVRAIFRDPQSGKQQFVVNLPTPKAMVHHEFLTSQDSKDSGADYDLAVMDIELWRPQIEGLGIEPLEIADSKDLHVGDSVAALGHPGTSFGGGETKDKEAEGVATHSLVGGRISAVRTDPGKPRRVQTDAEIAHGYSGGPLVLEDTGEVAAVNTWKDVDDRGQSVAGMTFSLAADQVQAIVEQGVLLSSIHDRIVASGKKELPAGKEELPEKLWSRWEWLEDAFNDCSSKGWQWGDRAIRKTNSSGLDEMAWKVPGEGPQHVAVLILPESPLVDLDVERLGSSAGEAGKDKESWAGGFTFLPFHDAKSGELLAFAPGETVTATVSAWFLGEPIEARYLILWMHSPAQGGSATSGGGSSSGSSGGGSSSPPPPPQPPPGSGTAPQPAAAPPGGWANAVEVQNGMAEVAYASSIIGFRDFDRRFLESGTRSETLDRLEAAFILPTRRNYVYKDETGKDRADLADFFGQIMRSSLLEAVYPPEDMTSSLLGARPTYELFFPAASTGAAVSVHMEVDAAFAEYLALPTDGLVSPKSGMVIGSDPGVPADPDSGRYSLPLDLPWKDDALRRLSQAIEIPYRLEVRYSDGTRDSLSGRIRVNPVTEVEYIYPWDLGFTAVVDERHPWVVRIINDISNQPWVRQQGIVLVGGGGDWEKKVISLFLVWRDLSSRGIRYQNLTAAEGEAQRVRPIHESLSDTAANCIDGTVLLASFMEAMGIKADIVLVPRHAFVAAHCGSTIDEMLFLETTLLGKGPRTDNPATELDAVFEPLRQRYPYLQNGEFNRFEEACAAGYSEMLDEIKAAAPLVQELWRLASQLDEKREQSDEWWANYFQISRSVGRQVCLVPVGISRKNGVRPIGHPADLDTSGKYRFPERR